MLAEAIRKYQTRSIEAAQVITQLIELAKQMREAHRRGENLGLSENELAFRMNLTERLKGARKVAVPIIALSSPDPATAVR